MVAGNSIEGAIVASVAYFDIFACAPVAGEIHRYLVGWRASRAEVEATLATSTKLHGVLGSRDGYWYLAGKEHLGPRRRRFARHSAALWPLAHQIARAVERSGLASCGMVTGSLAADNADEHADVDFLFTYPSDRIWTSYAGIRLLAKLPPLQKMCANYVLSEDALEIRPQNVFTAWELAKAVPLFGFDVYRRMVLANRWVARFLPNALPLLDEPAGATVTVRRDPPVLRALTRTPMFRALESMEKKRKFEADRRDVGVDMDQRTRAGSMDRHSPTRSFHVLCELRYRMKMLGLETHPLFPELDQWTGNLAGEMGKWGSEPIAASAPDKKPATPMNGHATHPAIAP